MKHKAFIKSLYHAAEIVERINKSKQKSKFGKILGEYEYLAIKYNCKEHNGILYSKAGFSLSESTMSCGFFYVHQFFEFFPSTRFYKISEGVFVECSSWGFPQDKDGWDNRTTIIDSTDIPEFKKYIYRLALTENQLKRILNRNYVYEYLSNCTDFKVLGFEKGCTEKDGYLYNSEHKIIAEGEHSGSFLIDDLYYVDQHTGICEDDFYGTLYYKINDSLFVKVAFSC